jgi:hypothetical protein
MYYYDHETHWITDNVSSIIATAPEIIKVSGCRGLWGFALWLQDPDSDGTYIPSTPAGDYEVKQINESWDVNMVRVGEWTIYPSRWRFCNESSMRRPVISFGNIDFSTTPYESLADLPCNRAQASSYYMHPLPTRAASIVRM